MAFSTENSGRRIVQKSPSWKSRSLNLGNRHRTTLNFADLVPAYWTFCQPGDKFRMDATILAKFLPLIAPAFSRMKIKTEWFYVPFRQISPPTLRALQDFVPEPQDVSSYFSQLLSGFQRTQTKVSENQQVKELSGFPSIPAWCLNAWLCGETVTRLAASNNPSNTVVLGSDYSVSKWRSSDSITLQDYSGIGWESLTTYTSKRRSSRLMSYMGLPSRLTTMQYNTDVIREDNYTPDTDVIRDRKVLLANPSVCVDQSNLTAEYTVDFVNSDYLQLSFTSFPSDISAWQVPSYEFRSATVSVDDITGGAFNVPTDSLGWYGFASVLPDYVTNAGIVTFQLSANLVYDMPTVDAYGDTAYALPYLTTYSSAPISLLPFQAYQKIFNDFYRDEKLQTDEIRYYPYAVSGVNANTIVDGQFTDGNIAAAPILFSALHPYDLTVNNPLTQSAAAQGYSDKDNKFLNNLFGLRRRNRAKDVLSSCVTSQVVQGQLSQGENETVYNANLYSKLAKYFMKKEFTGSTWAEWLNNFFGVNSNDLLNNNVIFLGGRESVVSISENIQNSESTTESAQGNRAGLANDFHNGNEIYFRCPDFGVIMCIVSVIPDDIDNYNGLVERFQKSSVFDFNLPDLQNIGFSPVLNRRANIGLLDGQGVLPAYNFFPSDAAKGSGVFGFQPFGYEHTYVPNIISGDLQKSLRFWHQSPDLDFDFTETKTPFEDVTILDYKSWANNQLALNANLPVIGLRFNPLGSDLAAQYYNNVFAVTSDDSGDHIVADMRFAVTCHRNTAFFTDAVEDEK